MVEVLLSLRPVFLWLILKRDGAPVVESLTRVHKPWVQSPGPHKPGVVAQARNSSPWEVEAEKQKYLKKTKPALSLNTI